MPVVGPRFEARGAATDLIASTEREVLYEGPANTGKTRTVLEKMRILMEEPRFSGVRQLWVRKTRKSLTQSVLVEWEESVVGGDHPCIRGTAKRGTRDTYYYAPTDCEIVLGGMDNPDRIMSTQYDIIVYFEATEGELDEWEKLSTRARHKRIPMGSDPGGRPLFWHQLIADCNPAAATHWLNQRAASGKMRRICAKHSDNPTHDSEDQAALDALTGARRGRLRDGLWVSEEGQIWECWDGRAMTCFRDDLLWDRADPSQGYRFDWMFGSMDFGFRHAAVFQAWGVIGEKMYLVAEIYKREKNIEWWAGAIERQLDRWDLESIAADSEDQGSIDYLNDKLGPMAGRDEDPLVVGIKKGPGSRLAGFNQVSDNMGLGRIILCLDAMEEGPCEVSLRRKKPTCTRDEIPSFRWKKTKDGQSDKEDSDPSCDDDGCFAMIYADRWRWGKDFTDTREMRYPPGSLGEVLDHAEVWDQDEGAADELVTSEYDEWGNQT